MAPVVTDDALGQAGGAGGVEDVERVGGGDRHGVGRGDIDDDVVPVAPRGSRGLGKRFVRELIVPRGHDDRTRGVLGQLERLGDHREVRHLAGRLDAAMAGDDDLGPGVVDADGQLGCGESAKDDGVDGSEAGAGEHGDRGAGDHRHVDDHAVAFADALGCQRSGERGDLLLELGVGDRLLDAGDGRVVDKGRLVTAAGGDVPVDGVEAGVQLPVGEPVVERRFAAVDCLGGRGGPVDVLCDLEPEGIRVADGLLVGGGVGRRGGGVRHRVFPSHALVRSPINSTVL